MKSIKEWFNGLSTRNRNLIIMLAIVSVLYIIHNIYFLPNATGLKQLQHEIAQQNMTDEEKLEAQKMKIEDEEAAIKIFLEEATEKEDLPNMYKAQLALANLAYSKGEISDAIEAFEKVVPLAEQTDNDDQIVPILNEIGALYVRTGNLNQAHESFKRAHEINKEREDLGAVGKSHHNLGQITYLLGKLPEANKHYAESIRIHKELKEHLAVAAGYDALAELYAKIDKFQDAAEFQVLAINQYIIEDHKPGILFSYVALGQIYEELKDQETSCRSWKEALKLVSDLNVNIPGDRSQLKNLITDKIAADFCNKSESGFGRVGGKEESSDKNSSDESSESEEK